MILYHDTSSMVRSPDGDTDFFDNSAGVLQGDTLAPCIFIICLDYVLRKALDKNHERPNNTRNCMEICKISKI